MPIASVRADHLSECSAPMCGHATYPRARVNKNRVGAHVNPLSGAWAPCPRSTSRAQLRISGLTPPPQGPRCGTSSNPSRHRRRQPPLHFACNSSASHSTAPQKPRNTNALDSDPEIPTGELHAKLRVHRRQASQQPQTERSTPTARERELAATSATTTKRASDTTGRKDGGGTSAMLVPPTRYVEADSREAQASLGATSSSASPRWIWPVATGVTAPSFFLFVTTTGVMVS